MSSDFLPLIDTHCHLDFEDFDLDRSLILRQCHALNVTHLVVPGIHAKQWPNLLDLIQKPSPVHLMAALGVHPCFIAGNIKETILLLKNFCLTHPQHVIAIGEIGLDFAVSSIPHEIQIDWFTQQLQLATQLKKPLILHSRKSHDKMCQLMRQFQFKMGGIIHAFSGSLQQAERFLELGFVLGIGGAITYPRAQKLRRVISSLPIHAFVLETDAPGMPLYQQKTRRNQPENILSVFETLCEIRPETPEVLAYHLKKNSVIALKLEKMLTLS